METTVAAIDKIALALAKAQPKFKTLMKDKTAVINSSKGSYKYKYADLADVFISIRDALGENEIAVVQTTEPAPGDGGGYFLTTSLIHSSGQSINSTLRMDKWPDPKSLGIEMSYLRRYSLCALVGIASDDDTDADGLDPSKKNGATKKADVPPPSERTGLDPELMRAAIEDIQEADNADDLRNRYAKAYKLAVEAGDEPAKGTLLAEYRGHKLYVAPQPRAQAVT